MATVNTHSNCNIAHHTLWQQRFTRTAGVHFLGKQSARHSLRSSCVQGCSVSRQWPQAQQHTTFSGFPAVSDAEAATFLQHGQLEFHSCVRSIHVVTVLHHQMGARIFGWTSKWVIRWGNSTWAGGHLNKPKDVCLCAGSVRGNGLQRAGRGTEVLLEGQAPPPSAKAFLMIASKCLISQSVRTAQKGLNPSSATLLNKLGAFEAHSPLSVCFFQCPACHPTLSFQLCFAVSTVSTAGVPSHTP